MVRCGPRRGSWLSACCRPRPRRDRRLAPSVNTRDAENLKAHGRARKGVRLFLIDWFVRLIPLSSPANLSDKHWGHLPRVICIVLTELVAEAELVDKAGVAGPGHAVLTGLCGGQETFDVHPGAAIAQAIITATKASLTASASFPTGVTRAPSPGS